MQNLKFLFPPRVKGIKIFDREALFPVGKIYCIGKNYAYHAKEMGGDVDRDQPFFFSNPPPRGGEDKKKFKTIQKTNKKHIYMLGL